MIHVRRKSVYAALAQRVVHSGDLVELLRDAVLRQDLRWVQDQLAGRRSVI